MHICFLGQALSCADVVMAASDWATLKDLVVKQDLFYRLPLQLISNQNVALLQIRVHACILLPAIMIYWSFPFVGEKGALQLA